MTSYGGGNCPDCGECNDEVFGIRDDHRILACQSCNMLYFERPIKADLGYQEYSPYLAEFDRERFEWELGVRRGKYRYQLKKMRKILPQMQTLLEVGAGPGYFCKVAMEEGLETYGVEIAVSARKAGIKEFCVEYMALDDISDGSVDVVRAL